MSLLDIILRKPNTQVVADNSGGFKTFTEYNPMFTSYSGKIYEQELTRSAIESFATACSKLEPEIVGTTNEKIARSIYTSPNSIMTWSTFLKRSAAIYDGDGSLAVVPAFSPDMRSIEGFFPLKYMFAEVVEYKGEPWIIFNFASGEPACLKLSECCIINKFQIESDIFGERNCLNDTMQLIHAQSQAEREAIKNGARIRYIGKLSGQVREDDMDKKRERFMSKNLASNNNGGMLVYDQTWESVTQVNQNNWVISDGEMERIQNNVFTYFHINEKIIQNSYNEDEWNAYYEGKVEPFAIALGDGLTKLCFTNQERYSRNRGRKNQISFSSNRLEYASTSSKVKIIQNMVDRGIMTRNEGRKILQLPEVEGGDEFVIRGEYIGIDSLKNQPSQVIGDTEPDNSEGKNNAN